MTLGQTIPALPVRDMTKAVDLYRERLGFEPGFLQVGSVIGLCR